MVTASRFCRVAVRRLAHGRSGIRSRAAGRRALARQGAGRRWNHGAGDQPDSSVAAGRPTKLITNVTRPTLTIYPPPREKNTGTAMLSVPAAGTGISTGS